MAWAQLIQTGASVIGNAAKNLFNGSRKEARKAKKAAKKAAKEAAKQAKAEAKAIVTAGSTAGANMGTAFVKLKTWLSANWQIIAVGVTALVAIWFLFLRKKKGSVRHRSTGRKGSSSMKARMAKVRAARKKKRKK